MRKYKYILWVLLFATAIPLACMAGATFTRVKTWATGETLTASDLNAEFDNILNNLDPDGVDDESSAAAGMQSTTDPYPGASPSLATALSGEIKRLRYVLAQITGETYWYIDPDLSLVGLSYAVMQRPKFVSTSDTVITINPGRYFHSGTTSQIVYWNSAIAFTVGSGGSNAASDALGASEWHYIYLDDSAIVTQGAALLDADCFINLDDAPTWSNTKHGWYHGTNTSDRCIFAFYSDGDSDILEFFHDGGDYVLYAAQIDDRAAAGLSNTYTDVTLTIPGFSTKANVLLSAGYVDASTSLIWRTNGQTHANGHYSGTVTAGTTYNMVNAIVITDSSQKIEVKHDAATTNTAGVSTHGWYFPTGI